MVESEYLKNKRKEKEKVLNYIRNNAEKRASEISRKCNISYSTARRYRMELEEKGEVKRHTPFIKTVTKEQFEQVEDLYRKGYFIKEICSEMNITHEQFVKIIEYLRYKEGKTDLRRKNNSLQYIDDADINYIIDFYNERSVKQLASDLGFSYKKTIRIVNLLNKEGKLEKNQYRNFKIKDNELRFILDNYSKMPTVEIAEMLNVTTNAIYYHVKKLKEQGFFQDININNKYFLSDDQIEYIKDNYKEKPIQDIALVLKVPVSVVYNKVYKFEKDEWNA